MYNTVRRKENNNTKLVRLVRTQGSRIDTQLEIQEKNKPSSREGHTHTHEQRVDNAGKKTARWQLKTQGRYILH